MTDSDIAVDRIEYSLFRGKIDSLDAFTRRKKALADPERYAILYLIWEQGDFEHNLLVDLVSSNSESFSELIDPLLQTNLIARYSSMDPASESVTKYRITTLGKDEIESDLHMIGHGDKIGGDDD